MTTGRKIRAVLVDDEAPARRLLASLLDAWPRIEIVAAAADATSAVALIQQERPDLIFLDVQMPNGSRFDVLAAITDDAMPVVIFTTAYDMYALEAFDVSACDYLLKPFDDDRFGRAVQRAIAKCDQPSSLARSALDTLLQRVGRGPSSKLVVKVDGRHLFVDTSTISRIEANDKMLTIHTTRNSIAVRETLSGLVHRLDLTRFARVHRSVIVNRLCIREIQPWFRGEYVIVLNDNAKVRTGRHFQHVVRALIDG
jgi:two-component system LytT family response regulator